MASTMLFFAVILLVGTAVRALSLPGVLSGEVFDWLVVVGRADDGGIVDVLSAFVGTTVAAFGISLGGQFTLADVQSRRRFRRAMGAVAQLIMLSALLLFAGQIAACVVDPTRAGLFAATVPLTAAVVAFGVPLAALNVSDFDRQVDHATSALAQRRAQLGRLPERATASLPRVLLALVVHASVFGGTVAVIAACSGLGLRRSIAVVALALVATGLLAIAAFAVPAAALTSQGRGNRVANLAGPVLMILLVTASAWAGALVVAQTAAIPLTAVFTAIALVALLSPLRMPRRSPQWIVDVTVNGAVARSVILEVTRSITQAERHLERLHEHRAAASPPPLHARVRGWISTRIR
ncbi:hypothetical protein ITJ54_10855 [Curtobacterium sp. VKM Ac-2865]|uniref:hypothetical protein n=1 Tax=Curtobacterium sp. VKM Ac-2865 TaxID=2783817 RepID=UPI00188BAAF4|nr:hypothetical protein [Curtobacterium sp. VKM Ac-2865]MBF4583165.1 hypothetical protein [Curtobacterium sp. VKM Ac-2865]